MLYETDIVQRLWGLCHVLRDDGITYHEYVIELTFLLFLKMVDEHQKRSGSVVVDLNGIKLPNGCSWEKIIRVRESNMLDVYRGVLLRLGQASAAAVRDIFRDARTSIRSASALRRIVDEIDGFDWYGEDVDQFGAAYEGLLEKSADESKAGAGQYFTPRPLIDCIVEVVQPKPGERIQDPAAGSAGFLIAADQFIKRHSGDSTSLHLNPRHFQRKEAFAALELVPGICRLGRMNMLLHGIDGRLQVGDALGVNGQQLPQADVILSNPPFGTKRSEVPTRSDFPVRTSNKQLNFLQHIILGLSPDGGRAAVVLPDNALFDAGAGALIRRELMRRCRLHTILRLPVGIFYAPNVKTHVLFFCRDRTRPNGRDATEEVWVYDLRAQSQRFTKRSRLERSIFDDFVLAFGADPYGLAKRKASGEPGRFQCFTREDIANRADRLNLAWLDDGRTTSLSGTTSEQLAAELETTLNEVLIRVHAIQASLRNLRW